MKPYISIRINLHFLEWLEKNGRLTSLDPTTVNVEAPRDTKKRGTRCIYTKWWAICTGCIPKLWALHWWK